MKKIKSYFYILSGYKQLEESLKNKGFDVSKDYLLIISKNSIIGKLIRKKIKK